MKRPDHPIHFKKQTAKNSKNNIVKGQVKGSEKSRDIPKPKKIDDLISVVSSWVAEMEISKSNLLLALEEALPA